MNGVCALKRTRSARDGPSGALRHASAQHVAPPSPHRYAFGSRGPSGADALARRHGMSKFGGGLTPYVTLGERVAEAARAQRGEDASKKGAKPGAVAPRRMPRRLPTLGPLTVPAHRVPTTE